jgi:hypothetical protein
MFLRSGERDGDSGRNGYAVASFAVFGSIHKNTAFVGSFT